MDQELVGALKEMKMRAHHVIDFCNKALNERTTNDDMNKLRAHCKGITIIATKYLRSQQLDWYKLSEEDRSRAIKEAFERKKEIIRNEEEVA
jgi:hypothetical protein